MSAVPGADAAHRGQLRPRLVVGQVLDPIELQPGVQRSRGEVAQRRGLVARQADRPKFRVGGVGDGRRWITRTDQRLKPAEDRLRGPTGDLLPDHGAGQRPKWVERPATPPRVDVHGTDAIHERGHRRIRGPQRLAPCSRVFCHRHALCSARRLSSTEENQKVSRNRAPGER
jgi:hypothetical protein